MLGRWEGGAGWDDKVDDLVQQAHQAVYKRGDAKRALWLLEQAVAILEDQLETARPTCTLRGIEFEAYPELGAWYQKDRPGEVGTLFAPMNADESLPTWDEVGEIMVTYENA